MSNKVMTSAYHIIGFFPLEWWLLEGNGCISFIAISLVTRTVLGKYMTSKFINWLTEFNPLSIAEDFFLQNMSYLLLSLQNHHFIPGHLLRFIFMLYFSPQFCSILHYILLLECHLKYHFCLVLFFLKNLYCPVMVNLHLSAWDSIPCISYLFPYPQHQQLDW